LFQKLKQSVPEWPDVAIVGTLYTAGPASSHRDPTHVPVPSMEVPCLKP
jgi:hypothetical protein